MIIITEMLNKMYSRSLRQDHARKDNCINIVFCNKFNSCYYSHYYYSIGK